MALWWRGGRRGRPSARIANRAGRRRPAAQLRRGQIGRRTALLDITTDLGIPAVAAFSTRADGYGFALGMGARTTPAEAARSAIFEMCQSELSLHVIEAKRREFGEAALNESDRRQYARAALLDPRMCLLLRPRTNMPAAPETLPGDPVELIKELLAERGIVAYSLDLTRSRFGVPVVRVIAPGLQPEPCDIIIQRLARVIDETGGGRQYSGGIALL